MTTAEAVKKKPRMGTMIYLSRHDVAAAGGDQPQLYADVIEEALALHAEGKYVQPLKPYLRVPGEGGKEGHIADRIIAMPSYVGGDLNVSGLKWIGSKHDNPGARSLERASGIVILNDPETNYPIALMEAALISSMRTAAVTTVGMKYLAKKDCATVAVIGCGLIAERQLQSVCTLFPQVKDVHLYDTRTESAQRMKEQLAASFPSVQWHVEPSAEAAVRSGDVVIPCTVTDQPYIKFEWLRQGAFVSNISIMDLHKDVFLHADKVVVDDWEQSNREKKIIHQLVQEGRFSREQLHAELGQIVLGERAGRERDDEIIVLNPMGMALEDIACAYRIYERALEQGVGVVLPLYE
jgi:N-[(2S)-2-amino-2-carboxyethyl]-L-glutamate dehydrogenase